MKPAVYLYGVPGQYENYLAALESAGARVVLCRDLYRSLDCGGLLLPGGPYILAAGMLLLAALYVTPLRIPKPGLAAICLLSAVGALELAGLILAALGRL